MSAEVWSAGVEPHMPLLVMKGLTHLYGMRGASARGAEARGLHPLDLYVERGEIVGLMGANGAGKSTAFELIAGQLKAQAGELWLDGQLITGLPLWRRARLGLAYLAQRGALIHELTAREHLELALSSSAAKASAPQAKETAKETAKEREAQEVAQELERLLELAGLSARSSQLVGSLSGGERQRLALTCLWAQRPKLALLDEPFAALDPSALEAIRSLIFMLKEQGVGVLLTDHQAAPLLSSCDRVYLLHEGALLTSGTPTALMQSPLARARYLGERFSL